MPDLLESRLQRAGDLLDQWREDNVVRPDQLREIVIEPLSGYPAPPTKHRRVLGVAAVVGLFLVAGFALPRAADRHTTVLDRPAVVALAPPKGAGTAQLIRTWETGALASPDEIWILTTRGSETDAVTMVHIEATPGSNIESLQGEMVDVGGQPGVFQLLPDIGINRLTVGNHTRTFVFTADSETLLREIADLAIHLDFERPLNAQMVPSGWDLVASRTAMENGTERGMVVENDDGEFYVSVWAGVEDPALWIIGQGHRATARQVRDREGLAVVVEHPDTTWASLTWLESNGLVAKITHQSKENEAAAMASISRLAEDLVPLELEHWSELHTASRP